MNAPFNPNNIPEQPLTPEYKDSLAETRLWLPMISVSHVLQGLIPTHGSFDASQWAEYLDAVLDEEEKYMAYALYLRNKALENPLPDFAEMLAEKAVEREYQRELI